MQLMPAYADVDFGLHEWPPPKLPSASIAEPRDQLHAWFS